MSLYQLEVQELSAEEKSQYQLKATAPLETGLAMLRKPDGSIVLKLPISGDISSPEFGLADAIQQAVAKVMQQGARVYLAAALFPFGTAIAVAEIAGKAALEVRLDPVVFQPATSKLGERPLEYLKKLAKVMQERPAVHMKICGIATEQDRRVMLDSALAIQKAKNAKTVASTAGEKSQPVTESPSAEKPPATPPITDRQLLELASKRGIAVKNRLRDQYAIKADRLVLCQARIDQNDEPGRAAAGRIVFVSSQANRPRVRRHLARPASFDRPTSVSYLPVLSAQRLAGR